MDAWLNDGRVELQRGRVVGKKQEDFARKPPNLSFIYDEALSALQKSSTDFVWSRDYQPSIWNADEYEDTMKERGLV